MPHYFDRVAAPAITSAVTLGLSTTLAWKFRKHIRMKECILPTVIYLLFSITSIRFAKGLDLEHLSFAFGVFLAVLSVYFFIFSERISLDANWKTAALCASVSGITSGFFGIGDHQMDGFSVHGFANGSGHKSGFFAKAQTDGGELLDLF